MPDFLAYLFNLMRRGKFYLIPVIIVLVVVGGLIVATQGSALAPFIYTLF
jgi:hypothetical protein